MGAVVVAELAGVLHRPDHHDPKGGMELAFGRPLFEAEVLGGFSGVLSDVGGDHLRVHRPCRRVTLRLAVDFATLTAPSFGSVQPPSQRPPGDRAGVLSGGTDSDRFGEVA